MHIALLIGKFFSIIQMIIQAIDVVEQILPKEGQGSAKAGLVKEMLTDVVDKSEDIKGTITDVWDDLQELIEWIVNVKNKFGW